MEMPMLGKQHLLSKDFFNQNSMRKIQLQKPLMTIEDKVVF